MRFISLMKNQLEPQEDEHEDTDPELLDRFYGVAGHSQRAPGQTGAGHSDNESNDGEVDDENRYHEDDVHELDIDQLGDADNDDLVHTIEHRAVRVPFKNSPFEQAEDEAHFVEMCRRNSSMAMPLGYNIYDIEHEDGQYPEQEEIAVGFRKTRRLEVTLANEVWRPRAFKWICALHFLETMLPS